MLAPGSRVDRYVVEHRLGRGGFAQVWLVRHAMLGTRHALKVLHRTAPGAQERLLDEGRTQAQLEHRHVVPVRDVFPTPAGLGLLMPWVHGPSLRTLLLDHRPSSGEAAALLLGIARGVATAHAAGVVHRDLKPDNVLLDLRGGALVPRVADFGIAYRIGGRARGIAGTPVYAAPEQLVGDGAVDAAADVWALGIIALELLTGQPLRTSLPDPQWADLVDRLLAIDARERLPLPTLLDALAWMVPSPDPLAAGSRLTRLAERVAGRVPDTVEASSEVASTLADLSFANPTNLQALRAPLVGRDAALDGLADHLDASRLVSLLGPGGAGKTRLALEAAHRALPDRVGGVWFADLTDARSGEGIARAVARALGVRLGRADPLVHLAGVLADRGDCLLVLDNCEQVVADAAHAVRRWLDGAPELRVLATSREPLRLAGEQRVPLDALALPATDDLDAVAASPAVRLFVARAQAVSPGFALSAANAAAVARIVRMLDGLPLALELAAARVRTWPLDRLIARLADRFRVLRTADRDASARHRALRATLDWSWRLLGPAERQALAQLSVFEGGFTVDAAEAVVALDGAAWVDDVLTDLYDKSLLRLHDGRFDMLVSIKAFAAEALDDPGPVEARHGRWAAGFGTPEVVDAVRLFGDLQEITRVEAELHNLTAAARRAVERGDGAVACACAVGAWLTLNRTGPLTEAVRVLESAVGLAAGPHRAEYLRLLASALRPVARKPEAWAHARAALAEAQSRGDRASAARVHTSLGMLSWDDGDLAACRTHVERAIALHLELGQPGRAAVPRTSLGLQLQLSGDREGARREFAAALAAHRAAGQRVGEALVYVNTAALELSQGRLDDAVASAAAAVVVYRELRDLRGESLALGNEGMAMLLRGDVADGHDRLRRALRLAKLLADRHLEVAWGTRLGDTLVGLGPPGEGEPYLDEAWERAVQLGASFRIAKAAIARARVCVHHGDLVGAEAACADARPHIGSPDLQLQMRELDARIAHLRGDQAAAAAAIDRFLALELRPHRTARTHALALRVLRGDPAGAAHLEPAVQALRGRENRVAALEASASAALWCRSVGRDPAPYLAALRPLVERVGPHPESQYGRLAHAALDDTDGVTPPAPR